MYIITEKEGSDDHKVERVVACREGRVSEEGTARGGGGGVGRRV